MSQAESNSGNKHQLLPPAHNSGAEKIIALVNQDRCFLEQRSAGFEDPWRHQRQWLSLSPPLNRGPSTELPALPSEMLQF